MVYPLRLFQRPKTRLLLNQTWWSAKCIHIYLIGYSSYMGSFVLSCQCIKSFNHKKRILEGLFFPRERKKQSIKLKNPTARNSSGHPIAFLASKHTSILLQEKQEPKLSFLTESIPALTDSYKKALIYWKCQSYVHQQKNC